MKPGTPIELKSSSRESSLERLMMLYLAAQQVDFALQRNTTLARRVHRSFTPIYSHSLAAIRFK
jgi:hypothetical protein